MEKLCVALAFGVSEFCYFLVAFPARCVSSISGRFLLYGANAICFLPLVAILDALRDFSLVLKTFLTLDLANSYVSITKKTKNVAIVYVCRFHNLGENPASLKYSTES
jgi:hypothetical protein